MRTTHQKMLLLSSFKVCFSFAFFVFFFFFFIFFVFFFIFFFFIFFFFFFWVRLVAEYKSMVYIYKHLLRHNNTFELLCIKITSRKVQNNLSSSCKMLRVVQ